MQCGEAEAHNRSPTFTDSRAGLKIELGGALQVMKGPRHKPLQAERGR